MPPALTQLLRLFPFLQWQRPTSAAFRADLWAGISVALVLVPQSLAYATLAGMPPYTGLYAALLPAVVGILWGSSPLLAVGPVALTSILVFGSLSAIARPGSPEWIAMAVWLSLYSGILQFALGALKLGKLAYLVSQPVVTGFINAAAVIIIVSQLPQLLGLEWRLGEHGIVEQILQPSTEMLVTAAFGCAALVLLLLLKRLAPTLPGILIVTVLGIVLSDLIGYEDLGGAVVGRLPDGLPPLALPPAIPFDSHRELLPAALILAVISFTEAMSSCRVLARKTKTRWDENQELIGQGLAKMAASVSSAFPVSGSFSRSALNLYAGATSPWASLIATACVLVSLLFLTPYISPLPYSVLAAMIMVPVFNLLTPSSFLHLYRISRDDAVVATVTFIVTIIFTPKLHYGVFAGLGLTMVTFLYRRAHPRIIEVSRHPDGTLRDRQRFSLPPLSPRVLAVRMDSALNFLTGVNLDRFITERIEASPEVRHVLISASGINDIDATGVETLETIYQSLREKGITVYLTNVKKQVWDVLERAGLVTRLGTSRIFGTDAEAMHAMENLQE